MKLRRYKTNDGLEVSGRDGWEVAAALRDATPTAPKMLHKYMEEVAFRAQQQTGKEIREFPAEEFIDDLVAAGLLIPIP